MWMHSLAHGPWSGGRKLWSPPSRLGMGLGSLSWMPSPALVAAQPLLEVPCPNPAGKFPAALPSLKSLGPNFARGMSF